MYSSTLGILHYYVTPEILKFLKLRGIPVPEAHMFQYFNGKVITNYIPQEDLDEWRRAGKSFLDPHFFKKYTENYLRDRKTWWDFIRAVEKKDYRNANNDELRKDQNGFVRCMIEAIAYFCYTRTEFTFAVEQRLEELLRKHHGDKWAEVFTVLTTPVEFDDIQREHLDLLKLSAAKPSDADVLKHVSKYPWLVFGQFDDQNVLAHLRERISQEKSVHSVELQKLQREKEALKRKQAELLKMLGADADETRYLATLLQSQAVERMNIKSYWAGCYYLARNMWHKTAEALKLDLLDVLLFVSPPEVDQLLAGTYPGDLTKVIAERRKSYAIEHLKGSDVRMIEHEEADRLFQERIAKHLAEQQKATCIKGQTASLGKYTGKVRKVIAGDLEMLKQSIKDFKQGEIIVTSMTQPNMMVIAKKAGAIIADEGGITSHAAIISRELKIPCIVGCLHAMETLKDGDLVEVDADKGIVKKLS